MFDSVDRETARWIQKTMSRARRSNNWDCLFAREACWTPEMFAALVEEYDRLQLEGRKEAAVKMSLQLPALAGRIRPDLCPEGVLGQRSLQVWSLAVFGAGLRSAGKLKEAAAAFAQASQAAQAGVHGWVKAELDRRFAIHLLYRGDRRARELGERALEGFAGYPDQQAETLILRGICRDLFDADTSGAIVDFGLAASMADPARSARATWSRHAALHNLAYRMVRGGSISLEALGQARKMVVDSRKYLGPGLDARKLSSLWVEGLLVYRIGWNRHGERLLERARQGFLRLGRADQYVLTSLDLVAMLVEDGEADRALGLLRDLATVKVGEECPAFGLALDQVGGAREKLVAAMERAAHRAERSPRP